jgi:hypothetical protein
VPPEELPVLSASEIGSFLFCEQAWYLERRGAARTRVAEQRLRHGRQAHRRIGQATDRLLDLERGRRWLLVALVMLVLALGFELLGRVGGLRP